MALLPATGIPLNCGTISGTGVPTYTYNKPKIGSDQFDMIFTPFERVTAAGTESSYFDNEAERIISSGTSYITDIECVEAMGATFYSPEVIVESSNSGVLLGALGNMIASGVSAGNATLFAYDKDDRANAFKSYSATIEDETGATVDYWSKNYITGSVPNEASSGVQPLCESASTPSTQMPIFSSYNHATPTYTRNATIWTSSIDLTCISPWNSNAGQNKCGTLVSPRHFIYANHYTYPNGTTVRFVDNSNNVVDRTVTSQQRIGLTDIQVGVLDSDVSGGISFAKVLPTGWAVKMPSLDGANGYVLPALHTDQTNKIICANLSNLSAAFAYSTLPDATNWPARNPLGKTVIVGDSGSPLFIVINDELVLINCWYYAYSGPFVTNYYSDINAAMTSLGGGYSLTDIDLSSFTSYP